MSGSRHLFLTGFRGTGKSTVGFILSQRLGRPLVDLDDFIEQRAGKTIREIFDDGGEPLFRAIESEVLGEVIEHPASVISLGGGAILREENRALVRRSGTCFWLDADAETIVNRLRADDSSAQRRPALTNLKQREEVGHLLEQRASLYEMAADYRIETIGKEPATVAEEIVVLWSARSASP
jgi:shikimate kinase